MGRSQQNLDPASDSRTSNIIVDRHAFIMLHVRANGTVAIQISAIGRKSLDTEIVATVNTQKQSLAYISVSSCKLSSHERGT